MMVQVASECAIQIPDAIIHDILTVVDCDNLTSLDTDSRIAFWKAYGTLSEILDPITIDSIQSNYPTLPQPLPKQSWPFKKRKPSLSERCVTRYRILSMVTLLLLIAIQVYWYVGYALISDINKQNHNISTLNEKLVALAAQKHKEETSPVSEPPKVLEERLIREQLTEHLNWREAATNHLQNWNEVWSSLDIFTYQPWQNDDFQSYSKAIQKRIQFVAAENTLQAISEYLLPILYGLIGACFYILRQLPQEISSLIFSRNSYINYNLRLAQGPLAGMMISYFTHPATSTPSQNIENIEQLLTIDPGGNSLSPLALAFLAGYSIDFIFRFLDKILMTALYEQEQKPNGTKILHNQNYQKSLKKKNNSD
ncbi:hypothetical protein [Sneathiella limimaris]|uniref:hypothetical protein n=1 Tax=Sneathiella limimaris TaxID=1964213 RepID=UPI0019D29E97|nr:hypothetical protein [Sneathiella limimaris]